MDVPIFPERTLTRQTVLAGFDFVEEALGNTTVAESAVDAQASERTIQNNKTIDIKEAAGVAVTVIYVLSLSPHLVSTYKVKIGRVRRHSKLTHTEEYTLAEHVNITTPFSFLKTIFMGFSYEPYERRQILPHEASHVCFWDRNMSREACRTRIFTVRK